MEEKKEEQEISKKEGFELAIRQYFEEYSYYKGRTSVANFWRVNIILIALSCAINIAAFFQIRNQLMYSIYYQPEFSTLSAIFFTLVTLLAIALALPTLTLHIRRYRDVGLTGWGTLIMFLFFTACLNTAIVGSIAGNVALFIFLSFLTASFFFLLTLLPPDLLVTKSDNNLMKLIFRKTK